MHALAALRQMAASRVGDRRPVALLVADLLGGIAPIASDVGTVGVAAYDGSRVGPLEPAKAWLVVRSPAALRRFATAPGELGLARAYVAGDLDIEGDVFGVAGLAERLEGWRVPLRAVVALLREIGVGLLRPLRPPPEEAKLRGRRHSRRRDAAAVAYHYDVSEEFFGIVLGPSMTYSCAVFEGDDDSLERAQENKHELVCRKLGLRPGMRMLDVGCGWGSLAIHAAERHGAQVVGVTISRPQADVAARRVAAAGLRGQVQIRLQDYRDVADGPYDAVSSIGMFEHVGAARLAAYFGRLRALVRPGGRLLNHGISRGHGGGFDHPAGFGRRSFMDRYVFPDGELHEIGTVVSILQRAGFEVVHAESLREHYARTLRRWVANLERGWGAAVAHAGAARARIWRLYMAACALGFETNRTSVHQVLAVPAGTGSTGLPLRPDWDTGAHARSAEA
jgi:cyclopropane-fatty-acyl-phospholipid synthase